MFLRTLFRKSQRKSIYDLPDAPTGFKILQKCPHISFSIGVSFLKKKLYRLEKENVSNDQKKKKLPAANTLVFSPVLPYINRHAEKLQLFGPP